jgi:hypothetical protein
MAHFAQIDENNVVLNVIVVADEDCQDENGNESEATGIAFCKQLFGEDTNWVQSSYNCNFRFNHACIGGTYDANLDGFIPPKMIDSWTLDESVCNWQAPIPKPDDDENGFWEWDEDAYQADTANPKTQGWVYVAVS